MTIITIYLLVQLLFSFIFKRDHSMTFCGIWGISAIKAPTPVQLNMIRMKIAILGLYNQSRGEHGCGFFVNGSIYKGHNDTEVKLDTRLFSSYIANYELPLIDITKGNLMICHARQATHGAQTVENNHPFYIKSVSGDEKNDMIIVHNGRIENIWELCRVNDIDHIKIHVDSKALGMLIDKVGVEILEKYKGAAALVWTKKGQPNSLYLYHGATRKTPKGELYEERPMHYMKTPEGIYFSSMASALESIRENRQKVETLEYNTIFRVTNGVITGYRKEINRKDANLEFTYQNQGINNNIIKNIIKSASESASVFEKNSKISLVWKETIPEKADKDSIYVRFGRYYYKGLLCNGTYWLKHRGEISDMKDVTAKQYFFYAGVMVKSLDNFQYLSKEATKGHWISNRTNFAVLISHYSIYPVTNLPTESLEISPETRFMWYLSGRPYEKNIDFKFSSRVYIVSNGYLTGITSSVRGDKALDIDESFQSQLPFNIQKNVGSCNIACKTSIKDDGIGFDIVFDKFETALRGFSKNEFNALLQYCADYLTRTCELDPDTEEVEAFLFNSINKAVLTGVSIRAQLGDTFETLDYFFEISKNSSDKDASLEDVAKWIRVGAKTEEKTIEKTLTEHEDLTEKKEKQIMEIKALMEDTVLFTQDINSVADDLQGLENNDLAQEVANALYKVIDNIKKSLETISEANQDALKEFIEELNKKTTVNV